MITPVPDFSAEARLAAVNEACDLVDAAGCTIDTLCPACRALANAIEARLNRAFLAGQASVSEAAKLQTPHRA